MSRKAIVEQHLLKIALKKKVPKKIGNPFDAVNLPNKIFQEGDYRLFLPSPIAFSIFFSILLATLFAFSAP
jgi:hypothetical protein